MVVITTIGIESVTGCPRNRLMRAWANRDVLARIDLHWHDLRHEALSRLADDGVPVHELQLLAGHASITTTQRYMNARANSLATSMLTARERRKARLANADQRATQAG
jgi:integrase